MSLYAVQDNVGNYWDFDNRGFHSPQNNARRNTTFNLALADAIVQMNGGHVVELVEAPEKIVVSEAEAKMLTGAKTATYPAEYITRHSCLKQGSEDRLMRAYVNGWTVAKPKRWNVKVPHADCSWYQKRADGKIDTIWVKGLSSQFGGYPDGVEFTLAEIEHYDLQDCERVEVTDDEQ